MDRKTVSFRIDPEKEAQRWQVEQIEKSLRQADEGKLLPHGKVKQMAHAIQQFQPVNR